MAFGRNLQECSGDIENVPPADSGDRVNVLIILWSTVDFFDCLRTAVLHLVNKALMRYLESRFNGCQISHPSQRQHTQQLDSLLDPHDRIYQTDFDSLIQKLITL